MRLDVYLCDSGLTESRTEAKNFILSGAVKVNGNVITKPAFFLEDINVKIELDRASKKYVSRGGLKLEAAIEKFKISVSDKLAIDIGASSGGFTDCLLQNGVKHVVAIDSGTAQLAASLRANSAVTSIENCNARFLTPSDLPYVPQLAVMDVSFISATYIIPALYLCLSEGADFICLVKPQFEVGKANIGKGGIVKDPKHRQQALEKVIKFAKSVGFICLSSMPSPIQGGDGNIEYLVHLKK